MLLIVELGFELCVVFALLFAHVDGAALLLALLLGLVGNAAWLAFVLVGDAPSLVLVLTGDASSFELGDRSASLMFSVGVLLLVLVLANVAPLFMFGCWSAPLVLGGGEISFVFMFVLADGVPLFALGDESASLMFGVDAVLFVLMLATPSLVLDGTPASLVFGVVGALLLVWSALLLVWSASLTLGGGVSLFVVGDALVSRPFSIGGSCTPTLGIVDAALTSVFAAVAAACLLAAAAVAR